MKQTIKNWIKERGLFEKGNTVLAAVSGGPDSMALLSILFDMKEEWELNVMAAHVNHGLREETAAEDEKLVEKWCEEHNIPLYVAHVDVKQAVNEEGGTIQEQARRLRYHFFKQLMETYHIKVLAAGHHADDQLETMLMKQVTGRAVLGEAGIAASRSFGEGKLVRPLLPVTKEEILEFCKEEDVPFRTDESNETDKYTRNRFRHHLLPFLKQENPLVHQHFQVYFDWLTEERNYIEEQVREHIGPHIQQQDEHSVMISVNVLKKLALPLQRRGIHLILSYLSINRIPELSVIHIEQLTRLMHKDTPSFTLDWPGGVKVFRSYDTLRFSTGQEWKKERTDKNTQLSLPGEVWFNEWIFTAERLKRQKQADDAHHLVCRTSDVPFPLTIRLKKPGDKMKVLGMKGHKKVNRIFIDEKVPRENRDEWPIIEDAQGQIIWVPLLKKSHRHLKNVWPDEQYIVITCKKT